ncbi:MAG: hypothetical protein ACPL3C_03225 [Pyrobaculum sp.]
MWYITAALVLYAASIAAGIAGQALLSAVFGIGSTVAVATYLTKAHSLLVNLREKLWDRLAAVWLGGEYAAAIWLYVLSGVGAQILSVLLAGQLETLASTLPIGTVPNAAVDQEAFGKLLGVAALGLGLLGLALVWLASWAYLIELFTRDLYLIRAVAGVGTFKPYSATFYIILSIVTLGFLYFYWLYSVWRWISQLTNLTKSPPPSQGLVAT